ncbi:MAG: IS30 family transposase, partial [Candidatus Nealsonbacteria bacterium]|nr:IS30 family transposase [Candidatus Nealsonbacteria bacterium]
RKISSKRSDLEDREFIDSRPKSVFKRRYFWDWKADFIVSGKHSKGALLVFVERKSRYVLIFKLADRKVETINFILKLIFGSGQLICNTLTIDNDICFRHHKQMSKIIGAPIFFCHPYHS